MSIHKARDGVWEIRWREGGRNRSTWVHGSHELAKKIERKRMSARDENRHLDIKREVNFRMSKLIERYRAEYSVKKKARSARRASSTGWIESSAICSFAKWTASPSKDGTED